MARRKLDPPERFRGARLYRFGDEDDPSIWYPDAEIVTDDEGGRCVAVPIPEEIPPIDQPAAREQWLMDQRDLEEIARRSKCRPKTPPADTSSRDRKIVERYRELRLSHPLDSDWKLCALISPRMALSQDRVHHILREAGELCRPRRRR